jgi:hypothetical protein
MELLRLELRRLLGPEREGPPAGLVDVAIERDVRAGDNLAWQPLAPSLVCRAPRPLPASAAPAHRVRHGAARRTPAAPPNAAWAQAALPSSHFARAEATSPAMKLRPHRPGTLPQSG